MQLQLIVAVTLHSLPLPLLPLTLRLLKFRITTVNWVNYWVTYRWIEGWRYSSNGRNHCRVGIKQGNFYRRKPVFKTCFGGDWNVVCTIEVPDFQKWQKTVAATPKKPLLPLILPQNLPSEPPSPAAAKYLPKKVLSVQLPVQIGSEGRVIKRCPACRKGFWKPQASKEAKWLYHLKPNYKPRNQIPGVVATRWPQTIREKVIITRAWRAVARRLVAVKNQQRHFWCWLPLMGIICADNVDPLANTR